MWLQLAERERVAEQQVVAWQAAATALRTLATSQSQAAASADCVRKQASPFGLLLLATSSLSCAVLRPAS